MKKYVTITIGEIITTIGKPTNIRGYVAGVLEVFLPDPESLTDEQTDEWIKGNNRRMEAVCKFLNDNDL